MLSHEDRDHKHIGNADSLAVPTDVNIDTFLPTAADSVETLKIRVPAAFSSMKCKDSSID